MDIFYGEQHWYYPVKTQARSAVSDIFVCRGMGEEENHLFTVNRIHEKSVITYCLEYLEAFYTDFLESFFQEGDLYLVFVYKKGEGIGQYIKTHPKEIVTMIESLLQSAIRKCLPYALILQLLEEDCIHVADKEVYFHHFFRFPICWRQATEKDVIEKLQMICEDLFSDAAKEPLQAFELSRFKEGLNQPFEDLLQMYLYSRNFKASYIPQTLQGIKQNFKEQLMPKISKALSAAVVVFAVGAVLLVYAQWTLGHLQERAILTEEVGGMKLDERGGL